MARSKGRVSKEEMIQKARDNVHRTYKGVISESGSVALSTPSIFVSTGSLVLDRLCVGVNPGGLPIGPGQGRVVHIAGAWSTGKSVLLDHVFKNCQDMGGICLCSETEGSRDRHFADAIELDLDAVEIQRPETIEEAFDQGLAFHDSIRSQPGGAEIPFVWGIDSLDSTETLRTAEKDLSRSGAWHYGGGKSEALSAGLRKAVQRCARYPTTLVLLNQTRDVVGGMPMFGPRKTTPGGNPPHFYASLEMMLSSSPLGMVRTKSAMRPLSDELKKKLGMQGADKGQVVGRWVRAKITKTKIAPTVFDEGDFYIDSRKGVHRWGGILQLMLREGRIELTPDGIGVRQSSKGESQEFESQAAWLQWLFQHQEFLAVPKGVTEEGQEEQAEKEEGEENDE